MTSLILTPRTLTVTLSAWADVVPALDPFAVVYEVGTGVTGANCYSTVELARRYFIGRRLFSSAWTSSDRDTQVVALKQASALLDAEFTWSGGTSVSSEQGLRWPFTDATDRYGNALTGVPQAVRDATCELALYLLAQDRLVAREGVGLKSLRVDVISLVFDKTDGPQTFPSYISRLLVGYGVPVRGSGTARNIKLYRV